MTTQGILVDAVFSGLTGSTGDFVNKRLSGGRVALHPAGGANSYKNVYTSATIGGSTLIDQSVNNGVVLNDAGSAEVYAVGHYLCKAYDSNNVLQITFELRYGDVTSDGSGGSAAATAILDVKSSYGTNAADINNAITYANANSTSHFVFLFKDANFTLENNMAFPANVTMQVEPTAKLMLYAGVNAVTINGPIKHDFNQIFKYENNTTCTVTIDPKYTEQAYPQWFGAVSDGTSDSSFFVAKALATGIKRLVLSGGNFKLNSNITIPSDVEIIRKGGADFTLANGVTVSGLGAKATVFDKVSATSILGPVTGNVTGNLTGNVTGNVTGNLTGNATGDLTGDVTGNVTGNVVGDLTGNVTGNLTGDVTGNTSGTALSVTAASQPTITSLGTLTSLSVSGDLAVDTTTLKVDSTNNRVGIGTASPVNELDVRGNILTRASVPDIYVDSTVTNTFRGLFMKENNTNKSGIFQYGSTHSSEANNLAIKNYATGGDINFYTSDIKRISIDSGGDVLIGKAYSGESGTQLIYTGGSQIFQIGTFSRNAIYFYRGHPNVTLVGAIATNGTSTSYNTSSDYRLKENVKPIEDGLSRLMKLKPSKFNFISDKDKLVDGFLAHEAQEIVPECVTGVKDGMKDVGNITDEDGKVIKEKVEKPEDLKEGQKWEKTGEEADYQGIDQAKLVPLVVSSVQELSKKVTAQEKIIKTLQKKVN